jgi:glycosyltransferase involved in cell wall biosynthesis
VLRAEGLRAVLDRGRDRLAEWQRRRAFRLLRLPPDVPAQPLPGGPWPVLLVGSGPPALRLGGVQAQLLERLEVQMLRQRVALLYPERGGYRLELASDGVRSAVSLGPAAPPTPEALRDAAFERAVLQAAALTGARVLQVEGLAGLPAESLLELGRGGLRLILAVHDFGLYCARPHLLEQPHQRFCGYSRDALRCLQCLRQDRDVEAGYPELRRRLGGQLLQQAQAVVFPSEFLLRAHQALFGPVPEGRVRLVPPAGAAAAPGVRRRQVGQGPILHVACVGWVHAHKGGLVYAELLRRLDASGRRPLRFSAYGGGDPELLLRLRRGGVRVRGYYRRGSLARLLARDRVDLALIPSIVPESYSLVLDECRSAGVPVLAFDQGAVGERIRREGGGLLAPLEQGAAGLAELLGRLLDGAAEVPPCSGVAASDARQVCQSWAALYRELGIEA